MAARAAGPSVRLADISEFEPDIADAAYLKWSQAIAIRAAYGDAHADRAWYGGARRADLLEGGARFLAVYQYLVAGQDPAAQAKVLVQLLGGKLNTGEVVVCDLEEGAGDQLPRLSSWAHVITSELGDTPWTYSGLYFAAAAKIAPVSWVAAYQAAEPAPAHALWQFTDACPVPGVGSADCSLYHGTIDQLASLAHGGQPAPAPSQNWTAALIAELAILAFGASGEDVKSAQSLLGARGYPVAADGQYGASTRAAVTAFQHSRGLAADGVCGRDTWTKLHNR
jgi:hypothetical protein